MLVGEKLDRGVPWDDGRLRTEQKPNPYGARGRVTEEMTGLMTEMLSVAIALTFSTTFCLRPSPALDLRDPGVR